MDDAVLNLIDRIYAASLDRPLWPDVMNRMANLMGAAEATLHFSDTATGERIVVAPRADPDYLASYREHWVRLNPLMGHVGKVPSGELIGFAKIVPPDEFERTPFFNEWWAPQGLGVGGLGITLMSGAQAWAGCAVHPASKRPLRGEAETLFEAVRPHLVRAFEIQFRLGSLKPGGGHIQIIDGQIDNLRRRFGLTRAEAILALEICKGDGRAAAAKRCGISVSTAHTHLNRIFSKTGTRRQAELLRLLLNHSQ